MKWLLLQETKDLTKQTAESLKLTGDTIDVNGYRLFWNEFWKEWHLIHDIVGLTAFRDFFDAVEHAEKG